MKVAHTLNSDVAARAKKALKLIKEAEKMRPEKAGAWIETFLDREYQSFLNHGGHFGFLLNPVLPGLPEINDGSKLASFINSGGDPVEDLPAQLAEARRILAEYKASTTAAERKYKTNPPIIIGKCGYNPQYLLDVCAILGGDITMYQDDNKPTSPARLESENGIAILLPVRLKN